MVAAVSHSARVSGAPQDFYRYPARFSPWFARAAIQAFTNLGDVVIDPFCGGGTAIVEALALGRRAIGADISTLATFLTRTKTTPLSIHDRREIEIWLRRLKQAHLNSPLPLTAMRRNWHSRNLPREAERFFHWILAQVLLLTTVRQRNFVRLILLSVGQRMIDCKVNTVSRRELREDFCKRLAQALTEFSEFTIKAAAVNKVPNVQLISGRRVICRSSDGLHTDRRIPSSWLPAKLVLTSPPYPGVHVLYHRWQINGRKETPAPFWLANQKDGSGESYYALGSRGQPGLRNYYKGLEAAFASVAKMLDSGSIMMQLVAFSDPSWQLAAYLKTLEKAGFKEAQDCHPGLALGQRIWRAVPSRKWYATRQGAIPPSKEVLLVHKLA